MFGSIAERPGLQAALEFVLLAIESHETKDDMGERRQYAVSLERFEFASRLYRLPSDARSEPPSGRVPLRDWWHAWEVARTVAHRANASDVATVSQKAQQRALTPGPAAAGSKWVRRA